MLLETNGRQVYANRRDVLYIIQDMIGKEA
jgi:hypothetical protein